MSVDSQPAGSSGPSGKPKETAFEAGVAAHRRGEHDAALRYYTVAIMRGENLCPAYTNTAQILRQRARFDAAVIAGRRAVAINPNAASALNTLANALVDSGHPQQALEYFRKAVDIEGGSDARTIGNLGIALRRLGQLREALACFERSLEIAPGHDNITFHRAMALLQLGDYARGWPAYESRWTMNRGDRRRIDEPIWDGSPFPGKRLHIHAEQGFGDTLQFCRFVAAAKARGGTVIVECQAELERLMRGLAGADEIVVRGTRPVESELHIPVASLPLALGIGADDLAPRIPYLTAPSEARAKFAPRLERWRNRFKVGIVWSGSVTFVDNVYRSADLDDFLGLASIPGVQLFSLQKGPPALDRGKVGAIAPLLIDATGEFEDFADTAGFIEGLDLVIMTDSSVAHLTGAIGRPVWTLLMRTPDWRWLIDRTDSPWYPTMRLFSQPRFGDWSSVFRDVAKALREEVTRAGLMEAARQVQGRSIARDVDGSTMELESVQRGGRGGPRFVMPIPRSMSEDAGVRLLVSQETKYGGFEYATRRFFDEHLPPGAAFIDVGAHWGVYSLAAATLWRGLVDVLAIEASPANVGHCRTAIARNALGDRIELVAAAAAARAGRLRVTAESSMGHKVTARPGPGPVVPSVTLDSLVAGRPHLRGRPTFIKIDVEGFEPNVIAGARALIASGDVRAIVWERGRSFNHEPYRARLAAMVTTLEKAGFRMWRLPHELLGGPLVPWVPTDDLCNVFALPVDFQRRPCYGPPARFRITRPFRLKGERTDEQRIADTELLIAHRGTDCQRWADFALLGEGAEERAVAAAAYLRSGTSILDLGSGTMRLEKHLPAGARYHPVDLVPFRSSTIAVDFNQGQFPARRADTAVGLAVLPYIHDVLGFLARMKRSARDAVITYPLAVAGSQAERRASGYFNDFDAQHLRSLIDAAGWKIGARRRVGDEVMIHLV